MIFYFSGTGNSRLAAKQIARAIDDESADISHFLKERKIKTFHSERPLIFVTPTYAWRMPKVVEQWIRAARFEGCRDTYFILTCGASCGNAGKYAKKLCQDKGLHFCGLASVIMPENYIAMFKTPSEAECRTILEKAEIDISALAEKLLNREPFPETPVSFVSRRLSGLVNVIFYPLFVHDKGFTVSADCVSCGKCAQRCPLNNIDIADGKPVWKGTCTHCMACIGGCPTGAIDYKSNSKGQRRYYITEE